MNKQEIHENMMFLFVRGSNAYGTNNAQSDEDIGGICLPTRNVILGVEKFEQDDQWFDENGEKLDTSIYNFNKAIDLFCENNPNMLDFLYAPERCIKFETDEWNNIREIRDEFMCIKSKWTYQGYAISQLNRIKTHRGYLLNPIERKPLRSDFGLPDISIFPETQIEVLAKLSSEWVVPKDQDAFYSEITRMFDAEGSLIFKKYIDPKFYSIAIADFKKRQRDFLRMISSVSQFFLKEEYLNMAHKELHYIAAIKDWNAFTSWKKNRNSKRAEMEAKTGYDCYSYDTEFLTDRGWLIFDDITPNTKLATVNPSNIRVEYHNYIERFDGTFTGNMYHFTGAHTDILVTPNHKMWVSDIEVNNKVSHDWKFKDAACMHNTFEFLNTINPKINTQLPNTEYINKSLNIDIMDYMRLMGWFLSDGTCGFKNGKLRSVRISQSKPQSRLTQTFTKQIKRNKIRARHYIYPPREHQRYSEHIWVLPRDISESLYSECGHGSHNKRIPRWVFNLTRRNMKILLKSMLQGDGTQRAHDINCFVYYSASNKLASDVQELALMCGLEASLWGPYASDTNFGKTSMYQVHIKYDAPKVKRMHKSKNVTKISVTEHRIVCFTVPNHILITRRNGKTAIQGNCKHAMHLVRLLTMGNEILEGKGVNVDRTGIDQAHLMDIRNGVFTFDEIESQANELNLRADENYKTTTLPKNPNLEKINALRMDILERHLWNIKGSNND